MNKSYKSYAFLLAMTVAIASPVRAMENQVEVSTQQQTETESCEQQSVVWYKKCSNQVAAGIVVLAAVYALAVHMDKIASPVGLFAAAFCPQAADVIVPAHTNNQKTEIGAPKTSEPTVDPSTKVDVESAPNLVDEKNDEIGGADMESYTPVAPSNQNVETPEISFEQLKAVLLAFWKTPAEENPATEDLFRTQYE